MNSPFPANTLPEARMPPHITHNGGGCRIAYKNQALWATTFRNLPLPGTYPKATTCVIELILHSGDKVTIIACYLPQATDNHSRTCKALSHLTHTLPHQLLTMGGDFLANWTGPNAKEDNVQNMPYQRWEGPMTLTCIPQSKLDQATCIDHFDICDPKDLTT